MLCRDRARNAGVAEVSETLTAGRVVMVLAGPVLQEMVMLECRRGSPVEIHISMVEVTRMHRRTAGSQAEMVVGMEEEVMVEAAEIDFS